MTLNLTTHPGRCVTCEWHPATQGHAPSCAVPAANRDDGMARADAAADPDVKAALDSEIRRLAATGREFSANALRHLGATGGVVGSRFTAAHKAGVIRPTGNRVQSNLASTHAHELKCWIGGRG